MISALVPVKLFNDLKQPFGTNAKVNEQHSNYPNTLIASVAELRQNVEYLS